MTCKELDQLLSEIEQIISRIGCFDVGKNKLTIQGRYELTQLFHKKLHEAIELKKSLSGSFKIAS